MGASPAPSWRGSYLEMGKSQQAKSGCVRLINSIIFVCGISYLLYVIAVAVGPLARPAHSVMKLRVHLRGGANAGVLQLAGQDQEVPETKVIPGQNQAPSLQAGAEPELEEMLMDTGEEAAELYARAGTKPDITGKPQPKQEQSGEEKKKVEPATRSEAAKKASAAGEEKPPPKQEKSEEAKKTEPAKKADTGKKAEQSEEMEAGREGAADEHDKAGVAHGAEDENHREGEAKDMTEKEEMIRRQQQDQLLRQEKLLEKDPHA